MKFAEKTARGWGRWSIFPWATARQKQKHVFQTAERDSGMELDPVWLWGTCTLCHILTPGASIHVDGFPHPNPSWQQHSIDPHFSAKSRVAQSALALEHFKVRWSPLAICHIPVLFLFSLSAGVVAHIVMLGNQCHWGCDPQGCLGKWVVSFAIHLMPESRQLIALLQDVQRSLQVSVVWMWLILVYDLTALKQPVNVLFSLQLSHWKPSLIELSPAW